MKLLQSEFNFGYQVQAIELSQIKVDETQTVVEASPSWAIFPRQHLMALSIGLQGMKNPVIIQEKDGELYFTASGARIQYAVLNGYTHIDAIVLNDLDEIRELMIEQAKTEANYISSEYIDEWWIKDEED